MAVSQPSTHNAQELETMAGVRAEKAAKMQEKASEASTRTRKGRNKVEKLPRQDKKKPTNSGKAEK